MESSLRVAKIVRSSKLKCSKSIKRVARSKIYLGYTLFYKKLFIRNLYPSQKKLLSRPKSLWLCHYISPLVFWTANRGLSSQVIWWTDWTLPFNWAAISQCCSVCSLIFNTSQQVLKNKDEAATPNLSSGPLRSLLRLSKAEENGQHRALSNWLYIMFSDKNILLLKWWIKTFCMLWMIHKLDNFSPENFKYVLPNNSILKYVFELRR